VGGASRLKVAWVRAWVSGQRNARVSADTRATAVVRRTPVPTGLVPVVPRPGPLFRA
jgi:hypothetical protein